jgi:hypothetical protein
VPPRSYGAQLSQDGRGAWPTSTARSRCAQATWACGGFGEPAQLIGDGAGFVLGRIERGREGGGILDRNEIAEEEPSAWREAGGDSPEELRLSGAVKVVDAEHRDDYVERTVGEWVFEACDAQLGAIGRESCAGALQYLGACVEPDERRR